ncbi:MAG: sporulation protein YabP [Acutalibacteraceae bacterium]|nr:sporulation protein YabP [Acutalibacteraceae bacterium]
MEENVRRSQNVIIEDRKKMTFTGVKDVLSFDEETVIFDTVLGRMTVKGTGLHILNFDNASGELTAEGKLFALAYTGEDKKGGFLSRIFR